MDLVGFEPYCKGMFFLRRVTASQGRGCEGWG
jgi:hypothetical protein